MGPAAIDMPLGRYSDAWFTAAKRRRKGERAGFPRRKRLLVPVRFHHQTFRLQDQRVRLPVARGRPALWVRLARPLPYPADQVRAVTLAADGGRLWLAVTAAVPVHQHDLDPGRLAGVDLGIIHPFAVVAEQASLLVSGRAIRAESFLHLRDQQTRQAKTARRAPNRVSMARAAGGAIEPPDEDSRAATAAGSTKPTIRRPARSSTSRSAIGSGCWSSATPPASPPTTPVACTI
jgi:transposase